MRAHSRRGFTLVELLIAMTVGVIILGLASQIVLSSMQSMSNGESRASVDRNGRFVGLSLQRDLQEAGVDLASSTEFGSVHAYGDTLVVLRVPYDSINATFPDDPSFEYPATFATRPASGTSTCGTTCINVSTGADPFDLEAGDVALLQAGNVQRLILVSSVAQSGSTATINWTNLTTFLGHQYGVRNPDIRLAATPTANIVRKLNATMYYRSADTLFRATEFVTATGRPNGQMMATGVTGFRVWLNFINGDSAATAVGAADGNANNDPNDISAVIVSAVMAPDPNDIRRGYSARPRTFRWFIAPRNLAYERNAI